ncbi:hypothetical protein MKLM6_0042 [Methylomonas koyamae]|nr:hypothetical protein MKLM6_0042 [Methylomonas koyamae]
MGFFNSKNLHKKSCFVTGLQLQGTKDCHPLPTITSAKAIKIKNIYFGTLET